MAERFSTNGTVVSTKEQIKALYSKTNKILLKKINNWKLQPTEGSGASEVVHTGPSKKKNNKTSPTEGTVGKKEDNAAATQDGPDSTGGWVGPAASPGIGDQRHDRLGGLS